MKRHLLADRDQLGRYRHLNRHEPRQFLGVFLVLGPHVIKVLLVLRHGVTRRTAPAGGRNLLSTIRTVSMTRPPSGVSTQRTGSRSSPAIEISGRTLLHDLDPDGTWVRTGYDLETRFATLKENTVVGPVERTDGAVVRGRTGRFRACPRRKAPSRLEGSMVFVSASILPTVPEASARSPDRQS